MAQSTDSSASVADSAANLDLARSVAVTGREAFNAGDYETALTLFRRAHALFPAPTLVLYEARSLQKMGQLIEALQAYGKATRAELGADAPPQFLDAIQQARDEARELEARIPTLTLEVKGVSGHDPTLEISINGRAIGAAQIGQAQRLNPGRYRVRGAVQGRRVDEAEAALSEGQNATLVLDLAAPTLSPPAPRHPSSVAEDTSGSTNSARVLAYVAGGVGITGIGAGVVTGLMSSSKHAEAKKLCPDDECVDGGNGAVAANAFRSLRTVSSVSYAVGAAGLATGVILLLTSSDGSDEQISATITPLDSGYQLGVRGRF